MVLLSPHDTSRLTRLVSTLSTERQRMLLEEIEDPEALMVGEAYIDQQKYDEAAPRVRATVDQFRLWVENNRRIRLRREARQRARMR